MATAAQISANRANAQLSTGPRSPEGKAKAARNHTSHGLSSREFIVLPGQEAEFDEFMASLRQDIQPHGSLENDLFAQLAHASWTLRRCRAAEVELYRSAPHGHDPLLIPHFDGRLRTIDLFTRRAERAHQRALKELKTLQTNRTYKDDLEDNAYGRPSDAHPAPLAENLALDAPRRKFAHAAADTRAQLSMARSSSGIPSGFSNPIPRRALAGQSNPIPEPIAAAAAR